MSKYIDAEKLRKLLANRYEEITVPVLTDEGGLESFYRRSEIHNILKIVDSFQQEQQEEPDKSLEEAAEKSSAQYYVDAGYSPFPNVETAAHKSGFIAGAEYMRKKDVEDMYMSDNRIFLKCYEQGKVDMKEQMLKEAVEGEIQMRYSGCLCAKTIRAINEDKFKLGDKVCIIIVREEKK
jgi:hypothetical protein